MLIDTKVQILMKVVKYCEMVRQSIIETVNNSIEIPLAHIGHLSYDTEIFPLN